MQIKSELKYLVFTNKLKYLVFINKSLRKTEKNEQRLWTGNSDRKGGRGSVCSVATREQRLDLLKLRHSEDPYRVETQTSENKWSTMFNKMGSSNRKFKFKNFYFSLNYIQLPGFSVAGFRDFTGSLRRHCEGPRQEASLVL